MKMNYQKELDKLIATMDPDLKKQRLLLHSCCAPCSSYVVEYLKKYFNITLFFYNPNITSGEEYKKRLEEQREFIADFNTESEVKIIEGNYDTHEFFQCIKGYEDSREGGERCFRCYKMRLEACAKAAADMGYEYFGTVLTISPLKNADKINEIGRNLEEKYGVKFLFSDFKKKGGYKRSVDISKEYGLYRQDYCGCVFSKNERAERSK